MIEQGLPIIRITDPAARFDRVRELMKQWHAASVRARRAHKVFIDTDWDDETDDACNIACDASQTLTRQANAAELEFLVAAETYFMMGRP